MAVDRERFLELAADAPESVRAVGAQGSLFHLVCDGHTLASKNRPIEYPSLNHVADWLQRQGISRFVVDTTHWRASDTGRSRSAGRP